MMKKTMLVFHEGNKDFSVLIKSQSKLTKRIKSFLIRDTDADGIYEVN